MSDHADPQTANGEPDHDSGESVVAIVDDDDGLRDALEVLICASGWRAVCFNTGESFLESLEHHLYRCALIDVRLPGIDGITVFRRLTELVPGLPVVIITGHGDVPMAVDALKAGAVDFIEKPFDPDRLLDSLRRALSLEASARETRANTDAFKAHVKTLTPRELDVMDLLVLGHPNKIIASKLGISPRTVEVYRARVMEKMEVHSLAELVRLTLSARD